MIASRFDALVRSSHKRSSRRRVLAGLAASGAALALSRPGDGRAQLSDIVDAVTEAHCRVATGGLSGCPDSWDDVACRLGTGGLLNCEEAGTVIDGVEYALTKKAGAEEYAFSAARGLSPSRALAKFFGLPDPTNPAEDPILQWIVEKTTDQHFRPMTEAEDDAARGVFGDSLGPRDRIVITDLENFEGHPFVWFGPKRQWYIVNMGAAYADPVAIDKPVFMHELVHVWQLRHEAFDPWICKVVMTHGERIVFKRDVYDYGQVGKDWSEYNPEQQGELVEAWVDAKEKPYTALYPYIQLNIRRSDPDAKYQFLIPPVPPAPTACYGITCPVVP
jgi:hypothetical protein